MDVGDWDGEAKLVGDTGGTGEAIEDVNVLYKSVGIGQQTRIYQIPQCQ